MIDRARLGTVLTREAAVAGLRRLAASVRERGEARAEEMVAWATHAGTCDIHKEQL